MVDWFMLLGGNTDHTEFRSSCGMERGPILVTQDLHVDTSDNNSSFWQLLNFWSILRF
jgi:hypothetical protein